MRSCGIRNWAGQTNLRGKRVKKMGCGCCEVTDLRPKEREKQAKREMRTDSVDEKP